MSTEEKYQSGLTRISIMAIIYATFVFIPAVMYLSLVTGGGAVPASWFVLILWVEIARFMGKRLTKQEAFLLYVLSGSAIYVPTGFIYSAWLRTSGIVQEFGYANEIPDWVAPSPESGVFLARSLFRPEWIQPYLVNLIIPLTIATGIAISLGWLARELFIEVENLPFPLQQMDAKAVIVLTEGEETPLRILSVFGGVGFFWGFLVYAMPSVLQAWTGQAITIVPIPWVDLTTGIQTFMPGAMLGIATDIGYIMTGFILPFSVVMSMVIGSFAVWFFGNWLTVVYGLSIKPWWKTGMDVGLMYQRATLYVWAAPLIGFALASGIGPLIRHINILKGLSISLRHPSGDRKTDPLPAKLMLLLLVASTAAGVALFWVLVPDFVMSNLWMLPLIIGLPIISTITVGRMVGEAGVSVDISPQLRNVVYYASGYSKADVWFAPNSMMHWGVGFLQQFKVAQLTETSSKSLIKGYILLFPLGVVVGLLYTQLFWAMAPIPSARYPGASIFWPVQATIQSLWIRGYQLHLFDPMWVVYAFVAGLGMYFAFDLTHLPLSFVALAVGANTVTPYAVTWLIGAIIGIIISILLGKEWWNKNKLIAGAGLMVGEAVAVVIGIGISLIINSIWLLPF